MKKPLLEVQNLNALAYEEIQKRIISREYQPGQRLVDSQLAEDFGISRTPIRDAMRKLTEDGLLTNTSSRGFYVFRPTEKDVEEIFELSEMIEITSAKKIIRVLSGRDFAAMEAKMETLAEKAANTSSMEADEEFKNYLVQLSDNSRLYEVYKKNLIQRRLLARIIFYNRSEDSNFEIRKERSRMVHEKIVFGIRTRNESVAMEGIAEHTKLGVTEAMNYVAELNQFAQGDV